MSTTIRERVTGYVNIAAFFTAFAALCVVAVYALKHLV